MMRSKVVWLVVRCGVRSRFGRRYMGIWEWVLKFETRNHSINELSVSFMSVVGAYKSSVFVLMDFIGEP